MSCPFSRSVAAAAEHRRTPSNAEGLRDLRDPELFVDSSWVAEFQRLRSEGPVHWSGGPGVGGFWSVVSYEEAEEVLKDDVTYSADFRNGGYRLFDVADVSLLPRPDILSTDGSLHEEFRKKLQPAFSPEAVQRLIPGIERRSRELIRGISGNGKAEFVAEVAQPLTLGVLADIFNLPESDAPLFAEWAAIFIGDDDPEYQLPREDRAKAIERFDSYVATLVKERADGNGEDLFTLLTRVKVDGELLDFEALCVNLATLIVAVSETTRHAISGALVALTQFPSERQKVIDNPELMKVGVKEIIRWVTPLRHVRRTAMRDTFLGGRQIREGEKVVVWYSSVNRDAAVWSDADEFRIDRYADRATPRHIAFGSGSHYCLGWRYAELELEILLTELLRLLPDIRVDAKHITLRSNFINGVKKLHVGFTPVTYLNTDGLHRL